MIKYSNSMFRKVLIASVLVSVMGGCNAHNGGNSAGFGDSYSSKKISNSGDIKDIMNASLYVAANKAEETSDYKEAASHYIALIDKLDSGAFGDKNSGKVSISGVTGGVKGEYAVIKERFVLGAVRNMRYAGASEDALRLIDIYKKELKKASKATGNEGNAQLSEQMVLEYAKSLISSKKPDEAIVKLEKLISEGKKAWEVYSVLGIAYDHKNQFDEAKKAYKKALGVSPDNSDVLNNMGLSMALSGDIFGAIEIFEGLVDNVDSQPQYRQNLGILLALSGDIERASDLAYQDLPHDMATRNAKIYRELMETVTY